MISGDGVLLTEQKDHIYVMTINREERRNAFSAELTDRLAQEWEYFNENDDLWVAVLTGAGDVAFCSGHDLKEDVEGDVRGGAYGSHKPYIGRRPSPHTPTWKPTIAAINGYCLAGGWRLAQECDVRIAAEHATFGMPEVKWNLPAGFGVRHEYSASFGIAAELLLWGRSITAQRAYEIGFVNKVVPADQLAAEAMEWAEHMCTLGQPSVRAHKEMLYRARDIATSEVEGLQRALFYWYPPKPGVALDADEGARAFLEKHG
jgi:enoyl-CoA hydratase/carnithine racemase